MTSQPNQPSRNDDNSTRTHRTDDLLTITEAAQIVRAPVATLRYWRHLGTGPRSFRLGRRVLYRYNDLITWINTQHDDDPHAG